MSSKIAISIKHVSKCYHMFEKPADRLKQSLSRGKKQFYREFWALRDVSFDVKQGETIGVIGRNGSGKSTILQIIAGTLLPTDGEVKVEGRIAALLELGSGFNPEFTGRENVLMSGAIMGLSAKEIKERMPLIEQFAEIGDFIDQPVKLYSSGMYVRLAFACAINVDPDILVIDEALAVGDMQFQLKCIDKLKAFKRQGKTILFVSHDVYSVRNFCDQAIWMMDGQIHLRGDVNTVTERYQDFMKYGAENTDVPTVPKEVHKHILTIDKVSFKDTSDRSTKDFTYGASISTVVEYTVHASMEGIVGGVAIYDKQNTYICGLNTKLDGQVLPSKPGKYQLILDYHNVNLLPGTYFVDVGFFEDSAVVQLDYRSRASSFRITSGEYFAEGLMLLPHDWRCKD
jgi:teichoic acid transport system ATP-binding protein